MSVSPPVRFRDLVVQGVITGLSFAQANAWTHVVDAVIEQALGPVDEDVGRSTLRALAVTALAVVGGLVLHRCVGG